ncbi:oxidoreductase [Rhizobium sp. BK377]|uniref:oxidoreductase n=1 Tax=Rhizobium sp. BK377 TaxID=2587058 RepID=UPI0016184637|nr:oxidoreductase [Rhizobium sp. BK377]MBB3465074.1 NAD(P)-dependent dehydrogenase (short-subunit alcohol dehydrogenase family) [Rhizobium sp. BK377]
MSQKIWFITGCSTGFGYELAKQVLERGDRAVLTARRPENLEDLVEEYDGNAIALPLDVTDEKAVETAVCSAEAHFGHIDVLVNNAGYGYFSAIEEGEDAEIRRQFETNVFGLYSVTRKALPRMRARRNGHIINISSVGGLMAFPATGYYHASKFAVEGFSESLSQEVGPLGIKVTIVEPGGFRTDWAGRSMIESKTVIDDYAETAGARRRAAREYSGKQPGDPVRGAAAIIRAVDAAEPPLRLLLGSDAYKLAQGRLEVLRKNFDAWQHVTVSTDFPQN